MNVSRDKLDSLTWAANYASVKLLQGPRSPELVNPQLADIAAAAAAAAARPPAIHVSTAAHSTFVRDTRIPLHAPPCWVISCSARRCSLRSNKRMVTPHSRPCRASDIQVCLLLRSQANAGTCRHTEICHRHPATLAVRHPNTPALTPYLGRAATHLHYSFRRLYSTWEDYPDTFVTEQGSMAGAPSTTSTTSNAKRKTGPLKFYAVKAGRVPGVYQNWEDVRQQTEGFNNHVGV